MVWLAETSMEIREAAERYGRARGVSSMWFRAIQEKRSYSYWGTEPSMQGLWPAVYLRRHQARDYRGATDPGGTLTLREDLLAWHLPRGRRQYSMAHKFY